MTIQDAIKTKKPFKRKNWNKFRVLVDGKNGKRMRIFEYPAYVGYFVAVGIEDILADDWEVKS